MLRGLFDAEEYLPELSVVAVLAGEVVGHVISTRGWVGDHELLGLGPIAVTPRLQRHGVGSALMQESIARANAAGESGIALLGSPEYYPRFGFVPAANFGVLPPDEAWGDYFQLLPLALWPGGVHGTFRYAEPFAPPDGIPLSRCPSSPIGRGIGLKIRVLWVRVPPGVRARHRRNREAVTRIAGSFPVPGTARGGFRMSV